MFFPFGAMRPEDEVYPRGVVLAASRMLDIMTFGADWRDFVPLGLAEPPTGPLSYKLESVFDFYIPPLLTYEEHIQQTGASKSIGSIIDFAFHTPSTALGSLDNQTSFFVLCVLVLIFRAFKRIVLPIFSSIGRRAGRATHGADWETQNEIRIKKFGEYVFRLLYHTSVSVFAVWYFWDKPWWDPSKGGTETLFLGHPRQPIGPGMAWYYLIQSAYNIEALLDLLRMSFEVRFSPVRIKFSKTCRGDFREMFVHHIVTNSLVIGSSALRFNRVGSMVFLVHDLSDVPVDLSKLANFVKWKKTTIACFVTMVLVWMATRLIILPFVIYKSILFDSYLLVSDGILDPVYYYAYAWFFHVLVAMIIFLHLVWFLMMIRMGILLVTKGETHDLTEHKMGEDQFGDVPSKQKES